MCLTPSCRGPGTTSTGVNFRRPFGMLPVYLLHRFSSIAARYESVDFQRPDAHLKRTRYICCSSRDMLADRSSRASSRIDDDLPQAHGIVKASLEPLPAYDGLYRRWRVHEEAHLIAREARKPGMRPGECAQQPERARIDESVEVGRPRHRCAHQRRDIVEAAEHAV